MHSVKFQDSLITPSKVVCIGRNYVDHIQELKNELPTEPVIFIKPNSAISNTLHAGGDQTIHFEGEIALLVEKNRFIGVGFGLDLTKRDLQNYLKNKGLPWERAKSFDRAAVFSEFFPFDGNTANLRLELTINNQLVQHGGVELMIYKPDFLLAEISKTFTLEYGDIVMTGTPAGAGGFKTDDHFTGRIYSSGTLLLEKSWRAE